MSKELWREKQRQYCQTLCAARLFVSHTYMRTDRALCQYTLLTQGTACDYMMTEGSQHYYICSIFSFQNFVALLHYSKLNILISFQASDQASFGHASYELTSVKHRTPVLGFWYSKALVILNWSRTTELYAFLET